MTNSCFNHVRIKGIKTVLPENYIDIDDELQYFDNNPKKLARAKKMVGYGRRYIADDLTTVTDLAVDAAEKLMQEMQIDKEQIELLIFVNQKPDYPEPCDACIAHGRLNLSKQCAALDINLGCSGYVHALWTAFAMIEARSVHNCLILAGDLCARTTDQSNRKAAPVFGDAASATFVEYSVEEIPSFFIAGADGSGWDKIIRPFGGTRLPIRKDVIDLDIVDDNGNHWTPDQGMMKGEDVFNFTMTVVPQLLTDILDLAKWDKESVDLFAIHQANKQIVDSIVALAKIPAEKAPVDVFSKYANNSTNSVVTVLCDQEKKLNKVVLCAFGIGLSWAAAALDFSSVYNGGISTYIPAKKRMNRQQKIEYWTKYFKGE